MSDLYNEKVMDHFTNPRNVGVMKDADGVGEVGNPTCGDIMKLFIKVDKKNGEEVLSDITFQTLGCGAAIATSSYVTEMAKGMKLADAEKITNDAVAKELGGLPPIKMHCSNLAASALREAIKDYRSKS
ncbi:MAG: iron-sulfur cluster assembly scaffold protein [Patescibacteria group bacterium]|nr:iron-sulfur cluster assembly scaffold protein [Patescibacteria group bacterium]